ncbi:MAG TPA: histidine kinase N-terminal 7TM domain-containing protein [Ktedonobacterales bacterium]|nr:histidine kinase N-terminal 7TM domain-containing protein [Ktedonobacterales bacterium]
MRWQSTPYELPLVVAAALALALAIYSWRRRPTPGALALAVLLGAVAEWSMGYALEVASAGLPGQLVWDNVAYVGIVIVPGVWLAFVLDYSGRRRLLTRRLLLGLAIEPAVMLALVWTNRWHGLVHTSERLVTQHAFAALVTVHGPAFWLNVAYSYALLLLGAGLLGPLFLGVVHPNALVRGQARLLLAAVAAPWIGNVLSIAGLSPFGSLDLTPFAFTISGAALAWSLLGFRLLEIVPVARDAVIESMRDAVFVLDGQDRIVDLNRAARALLSAGVPAPLGRGFAAALPAGSSLLWQVARDGEAEADLTVAIGGETHHFYAHLWPVRDRAGQLSGRLVVLDDITARVRAEEALRASEERFRKLFEEAPIGMALLAPDGHMLQVNRTLREMLGYSESELTALTLAAIAHPDDAASAVAFDAGALPGEMGHCRLEQRFLKKTGETLWAELTATVIHDGGSAAYRLAMIENIFERRRAELLEDEKRHVAYELHDGLAQVVAGAHLHMQAFAEHFRPRSQQAREELRRALELAQRATREARRVIAGLRPTLVEELGLAAALRMQVQSLLDEGWDVTYDESLGGDRLPVALETGLFRVALEALTNIRKHARTTRVRLGLTRVENSVRLEVRDWGCGFDLAELTASADGFGRIGLREMRDRVELLGGTFNVSSRPGEGCRIAVEVPATAPAGPLELEPSRLGSGVGRARRETDGVA